MTTACRRFAFLDVVADESAGSVKTPQSEFQSSGRFPIVDQGKELISGYTDDPTRLCKAALPVVVFGDHTRCFKFVDFPFCMGADGVKVLRPRLAAHEKYLFHHLRSLRLPDNGYDRHFKYLKRSEIMLPPLTEQRRIAAILDQADALRAKRHEGLARLDGLVQSLFADRFGDAQHNSKGWNTDSLRNLLVMGLRNGISPSDSGLAKARVLTLSAITGDAFRPDAWKEAPFQSQPPADQRVQAADLLICHGNGNVRLVGKGYFPPLDMPDVTFPDTVIAARVSRDRVAPRFFEVLWNGPSVRRQIEKVARTTNGTFKVNQAMLETIRLIVPPLDIQQQFDSELAALDSMKITKQTSLAKLDALFVTLQHRAFRGEL